MPEPLSFEWLLSPFTVEEFAAEVWQRRAHLLVSDRPGYFASVFGFSEFERVLEYCQPNPPSIRLTSSGAAGSLEVPFTGDGRLDMDRVRRHFADGYTIILNNVQRRSPGVAQLLQSMQTRMSFPVEANAYMTPPNSQGFNPHYDTHDVIVAHIAGEKLWRVYDGEAACPLTELTDGDPFRRENLPEPACMRLRPGDVLYIPRGWIHEAESEGSSSLHLTFGVHAPLGRDFIRAAIDALCRVHTDFRKPLPFGYLHRPVDKEGLAEQLQHLARLVSAEGSASDAVDILEDDFIRRGRSAGDGQMVMAVDALSSITGETRLLRKQYLHARLINMDDGAALQFSQSLLKTPENYREALSFALDSTSAFAVRDLPGLDAEDQINLAGTLLRDGFVTLAC